MSVSQPLAFAELLAGGILLTSAIDNEPIAKVLKGEAKRPAPGSTSATETAGGTPEAIPSGDAPPPVQAGEAGTKPLVTLTAAPWLSGNFKKADEELAEKHLGRKLTAKERTEI